MLLKAPASYDAGAFLIYISWRSEMQTVQKFPRGNRPSERIFYKYMGMDVDTIQQMIESHIAACVLTDKGNIRKEE